MIVLDTSALVRFLTQDDRQKALQVGAMLDSDEEILIPDVVFPELEYVLTNKPYEKDRLKLLETYSFLVSRKNIVTSAQVVKGVEIYANSKLDMADCIIAGTVITNGSKLLSFDKELVGAPGFEPGTTRV